MAHNNGYVTMKLIHASVIAASLLSVSLPVLLPDPSAAMTSHPLVTEVKQPQGMLALQKSQAKPKLTLSSDGLRLVNPSSGSTRGLNFGMKESEVITILTNLRGKPTRSRNQECGAGPLTFAQWPDGLTLISAEGRFAGWTVDGRSKGANQLTTIAGIGVGSTRAQLSKAYAVKVFESTLGTEFSAGDLGGILSGNKSNSRIETLWSGTTCFFR